MDYIKTFESFLIGEHKYLLVTPDKKYCVKTNSLYNVMLISMDSMDLKTLNVIESVKGMWVTESDALKFKDDLLNSSPGMIKFFEPSLIITRISAESINEITKIIESLVPMKIFIGAYEDETKLSL